MQTPVNPNGPYITGYIDRATHAAEQKNPAPEVFHVFVLHTAHTWNVAYQLQMHVFSFSFNVYLEVLVDLSISDHLWGVIATSARPG